MDGKLSDGSHPFSLCLSFFVFVVHYPSRRVQPSHQMKDFLRICSAAPSLKMSHDGIDGQQKEGRIHRFEHQLHKCVTMASRWSLVVPADGKKLKRWIPSLLPLFVLFCFCCTLCKSACPAKSPDGGFPEDLFCRTQPEDVL